MADDERQDDERLELPSLSSMFRRRRSLPAEPREPDTTSTAATEPDREPEQALEPVHEPAPEPAREPSPEPAPEPAREHAPQPAREHAPQPEPEFQPVVVGNATSTSRRAATKPRQEPASSTEVAPAEPSRRRARRVPVAGRLRRVRVDVHVPGPLAALLAGAIVGLVMVGLTTASLGLCSSMRGTSSCGKPGILLLLAITLVAILLGSLVLRTLDVGSPGSTSFLGVGMLVVLILLALLPVLDEWWVVIVVPLVAMLTYLVSWWITSTYVEPGERPH